MDTMTYNTLKTQQHPNGILQISLHRPDKLNALSPQLLDELQQVISHAKIANDIKALLITGTGKAFCAGADIFQLAKLNAQEGLEFARSGQVILRAIEQLGKPSVAAINGYAYGGGCELAQATTLRIASPEAVFAQPEVKLGVIPGYGGTQRLARLIGKGRAFEMCLTGRSIDADTALAWGLINEIVPNDKLVTRGVELLSDILTKAPLAITSVMQVIDAGHDMSMDEALHLEAVHFGLVCASQDKNEGIKAFIEKRPPEFVGE